MKVRVKSTMYVFLALIPIFVFWQFWLSSFYSSYYKDKKVEVEFRKDLWVLALRKPIWTNVALAGSQFPKYLCFSDKELVVDLSRGQQDKSSAYNIGDDVACVAMSNIEFIGQWPHGGKGLE